jgi:hypothetical protein
MSIDVNVQNDLVIVTESSEDITVNVSNAAGPAGVGVPVGGNAGEVLKKQSGTDYDTYWTLDGVGVPYTGATGDVNLGEFGLSAGYLQVDTTPTNTPTDQGTMYWDDNAETVALIMNGTIQKIGEDMFYHVRNTTGSTIPKGTAVRFSGTTGNSGRLLIAPMLANGTYPSQYYMGITSEELLNNEDGKVYHFGKMRGINTSAFTDGAVLYVSPSVAGALTATPPVAPNNIIIAAAVVHAANNGTLMIRTTLGSNINSDEGVLITTPANNEALIYESSTSLWKNKTIATALGYTPISGSGATGQVAYWNGTNSQTGSNNLFWDAANARLGIGTNTPTDTVVVRKDVNTFNTLLVQNSSTGLSAAAAITISSDTTGTFVGTYSSTRANSNVDQYSTGSSTIIEYNGNASLNLSSIFPTGTNRGIRFWTSVSSVTATEKMRLFASGNLLLQNGGTFTDSGQRLQVQGTALVSGNLTAASFIRSGGTSAQILAADGSVITAGTNITISGGTISASGGGGTPAGSNTQIQYNNSGAFGASAGFTYNDSTGKITLNKGQNAITSLIVENRTAGTGSAAVIEINTNGPGALNLGKYSTTTNTYKIISGSDSYLGNFFNGDIAILNDVGAGKIKFAAGAVSTAQMTLTAAGRLLLGTTTESTFLLDVNGTARISYTSPGAVTGFQIYNTGITANILRATGNGEIRIGNSTFEAPIFGAFGNAGAFDINGFNVGFSSVSNNSSTTINGGSFTIAGISSQLASGHYNNVLFVRSFVPTSGTATFNNLQLTSTINQTGGANGITRGLFINPTLTAAADWRAIEVSSGGAYFNTTSVAASAILQADSSTKGFLPPRMTNAQRTAISSPAVGLIVYCTDAVEGLYVYKSMGWTFVI